ncbi:MAG: homocysteine S-methyltransferase family protein, partial [Planctomycetota bacterium]
LPLWSARALLDAPETLAGIHRDYLEAGAGLITANTFRTHHRSLAKAGLGDRAPALTRRAVEIARAARDTHRPGALVLGSVAPLEDCYQPGLAPGVAACRAEHAEIIECLLEAGADLILIETMNNLAEARAAAEAARRLAPGQWMISLCTRPQGPPGTLLSGEPALPLLENVHDASAVGVNCVAAPHVEAQVRFLAEALPGGMRIMAYANVGYADEAGNWISTDAVDPARFADYARRWVDAGATIVGGCCGTTPDTIRALCGRLRDRASDGGALR